jgi:ubiquinone biosynthesis accessory factor UbiK
MQARPKPWTMPVRALRGAARKALAERPAWRVRGGVAGGTLLQCSQASLPRWEPRSGCEWFATPQREAHWPAVRTRCAHTWPWPCEFAPRSITVRRGAQAKQNLHIFCAAKGNRMKQPNDVFNDLQSRVSDLLKNSPARDVERNVRAMLSQGFSKLDLVTREEFDAQTQVLVRTRQRLEELERRVAELEQKLPVTSQSS